MHLQPLLGLDDPVHITDIGAAYINEVPVYKPLLDGNNARLSTFDANTRHH